MMDDLKKARQIYSVLFPFETENVPSFEELVSLVSGDSSVFSFRSKIEKNKSEFSAEASFPRQNEEYDTMDFKLAPFLIILGLVAAGAYGFLRYSRKDRGKDYHKQGSPSQTGSPPQTETVSPVRQPVSVPPDPDKYLLLAFDIENAPDCAKGDSYSVTAGRNLYDKRPRLLAGQTKDCMERIKQDAKDTKPEKGYAILGISLPAGVMSGFQYGKGSNAQRDAFEKLSDKSLLVLGFVDKENFNNLKFYDMG